MAQDQTPDLEVTAAITRQKEGRNRYSSFLTIVLFSKVCPSFLVEGM